MIKLSRLLSAIVTVLALSSVAHVAHAQAPTATEREQAAISVKKYYDMRKAGFDVDNARYDIVMLGDSITEGGNWGAMFPGLSIANRGIGGDTTEGMSRRLDSVIGVAPRKVFFMAGVNDIAIDSQTAAQVFERYRSIVDTLRQARIEVVVQSTLLVGPAFPLAINGVIRDFDVRLQAYCASGACTYVDLNPILAPTGTLDLRYTVDHLHLNELGYKAWREKIAPLMR